MVFVLLFVNRRNAVQIKQTVALCGRIPEIVSAKAFRRVDYYALRLPAEIKVFKPGADTATVKHIFDAQDRLLVIILIQ